MHGRRLGILAFVAIMVLALGAFPAGAQLQDDLGADATLDASASVTISGTATVPVDVSSASVRLRPTRVGPVSRDGEVVATPPIAAGTEISVDVTVNAASTSDASADQALNVDVQPSDPARAVAIERYTDAQGRSCIGIGILFDATVTVDGDTAAVATSTSTVNAQVDVSLDGQTVVAETTGNVVIDGNAGADDPVTGPVQETIPVETGGDICLPTANVGPEIDAGGAGEADTNLDLGLS